MDFLETKVGITIGDCNGIGPEILLKAFSHSSLYKYFTPVVYGSANVLKHYAALLNMSLDIKIIDNADEAQGDSLNVINVGFEDIELATGTSTESAGQLAFAALEACVADIKLGKIHNMVTLPINKKNIQSEEFQFAGHTDYLASTFETDDYMMLLVSDEMRVGVVTGHIPITAVSKAITPELLEKKIKTTLQALQFDFGLIKPKLAVLGLNPHSGDDGLIGDEELNVISPVLKPFIERGELVYGPYPADGFFGKELHREFDAVLAMYHDQGLIPFKQKSFSDGVNYTAGLPIVRTSPDHGTAYDIAGKGKAETSSLVNALFLLKKIYNNRIEYMDLHKNPLPFMKHRREKFSIGVPNLK
ncbi:MAG: 4-hydroxythreonine-4-phosphate dehydrogenase [Bacteroidia bacterium]